LLIWYIILINKQQFSEVIILSKLYNNIYQATNLFHENKYQKIFMGESLENPDLIVIINEFIKSDIISENFSKVLNSTLENLLYYEENDENIVFITTYNDGMSISQSIENTNNTDYFKINILHDYLNKLKKFDSLSPMFQFILANESQFFIKSNNLIHNELLIIDEKLDIDQITFNDVRKEISNFALKILSFDSSTESTELLTLVVTFFTELNENTSINTINEIYDAFNKFYIYDMYLDKTTTSSSSIPIIAVDTDVEESADKDIEEDNNADKSDDIDSGTEEDYDIDKSDDTDQKAYNSFLDAAPVPKSDVEPVKNKIWFFNKEKYAVNPLYIVLIIALITIALFAIFIPMINRITTTNIPIASFEKERVENQWTFSNEGTTFGDDNKIEKVEWKVYSDNSLINTYDTYNLNLKFTTEGIYKISLMVMDSYNNWSEEYSEEIYHTLLSLDPINGDPSDGDNTEPLNSYSIAFITDNCIFDASELMIGTKSIKMEFAKDSTESFIIEDLHIDNSTTISFWLKASEDSPITINLIGTNYSKEIFNLKKVLYPKLNEWQKIEFTANSSLVRTLQVSINGEAITLWIDDIQINSYK